MEGIMDRKRPVTDQGERLVRKGDAMDKGGGDIKRGSHLLEYLIPKEIETYPSRTEKRQWCG